MRIAYFSPLPPARSGIADYSRDLLPYLAREMDLTLYTAVPEQIDETLRQQFAVRPLAAYPQERWQFDLPLYQMGNSAHHADLYAMMRRYPGVVVLHDYFCIISSPTAPPDRGGMMATREKWGTPTDRRGPLWPGPFAPVRRSTPSSLPLNQRVLDLNLG